MLGHNKAPRVDKSTLIYSCKAQMSIFGKDHYMQQSFHAKKTLEVDLCCVFKRTFFKNYKK